MRIILYLLGVIFFTTSCKVTTGIVKGSLCYPSEYIPSMNVYIKDVHKNVTFKKFVIQDQKFFKFENIPEGTYVAYAYTIEELESYGNEKPHKASGGYTYMVPCGLSVECKDQRLIEFEVKAKKTVKDIKICDFYGPTLPKETE